MTPSMRMGIRRRKGRNRKKKRKWWDSNSRTVIIMECRSFRLHDRSRFAHTIWVVSPTLKSKLFWEDRWTMTVRLLLVKVTSKGKLTQQQFIFANGRYFLISVTLSQRARVCWDRAFSIAALSQWNTLPKNITIMSIIIVKLFVNF